MIYKILFIALAANHQVHKSHSFHEEFLVFHPVNTDRDPSIEQSPIFQQVYSDTLHIYFFSWQSGQK